MSNDGKIQLLHNNNNRVYMEKITELINAAEHGSVEAMFELDMMFYSGDGVVEDKRQAMKWLRRAADNGDPFSKELYNKLNTEKHDRFLNKLLGVDYITKYGKAVVLHSWYSSDEVCTTPLAIPTNLDYKWVRLAAYPCFYVDSDKLSLGMYKVGRKLRIYMGFPFYCRIGDTFSVSFKDDHFLGRFITCQLLGIIELHNSYAIVSVKVLSEGNYLSFVKKVNDTVKARFKQSRCYENTPSLYPKKEEGIYIANRVIYCKYDMGGDEILENYIFTDNDGIDHLVQSNYSSYHETECLYGDKVLGYHKYCPIEIKDGAAIHYTTR